MKLKKHIKEMINTKELITINYKIIKHKMKMDFKFRTTNKMKVV
jgi:hypothetical protein